MDRKSVALGVALGAGLSVLVGAARNESVGPVGRYRACCSQNTAYLVDTVTGQVWLNSEREFRVPKVRAEAASERPAATVRPPAARTPTIEPPRIEAPRTEPRPATRPAGFTGKWVLTHPTQGQFSIQIEPDGRAVLTQGDKSTEGRWRVEGDQIAIATEQESLTAQLDDQGRLMVREGEGEPIAFQRAD
jgi:hypothetical protein